MALTKIDSNIVDGTIVKLLTLTQAEYDAYDSSSTTSSALEVMGLEYGINLAIFNKGMMS